MTSTHHSADVEIAVLLDVATAVVPRQLRVRARQIGAHSPLATPWRPVRRAPGSDAPHALVSGLGSGLYRLQVRAESGDDDEVPLQNGPLFVVE